MFRGTVSPIARFRHLGRSFSSLPEQNAAFEEFRTSEVQPSRQSALQEGKFYTITPEVRKRLFTFGGLTKTYEKQMKTFAETTLMVRQPALEIMDYIKRTNFSKPVNRYVLYGKNGVGKSLTLAHLLHFGIENDFVLVHVPWVPNWLKKPRELVTLNEPEGFFDLPLDSAAWLIHFKTQNLPILSRPEFVTSKDHVWSQRETTPKGATLLELVEHGINRMKFASGTIAALLSELKILSTEGKCKTMVAIDGFNAFLVEKTTLLARYKVRIPPEKITIVKPFLDMVNCDWQNGVCILILDQIAYARGHTNNEMPLNLLGRAGFEMLDPFVPVRVNDYTEKEYYSCIEYYVNRRWIQNQKQGFDEELKALSAKNPYDLMQLCSSL
ncbi:small ribosomal subunit protein mS29 [Phlebotomus argentipes]|uniref:small ribosomal subunit protein mS29 n=1 Tax=Phlebotomus argentipes TaxID=94469 RepID=UPI002893481E|nr:small ribosomal subunit protein mS29 [Phlebotomus argentipes]